MTEYRLHWSLDWDSDISLSVHERKEGEPLWSAYPPRRGSVVLREYDDQRLLRDVELFVLHDIERLINPTGGGEWTLDPTIRGDAPRDTVQVGVWRNGDITVPVLTDANAPAGILEDEDGDARPYGLTLSRILKALQAEGLEDANRFDAERAADLLNSDDILCIIARRYIEQQDKEAGNEETLGRLLLEATCEVYGGDPDKCPPDQLSDYEETARLMAEAAVGRAGDERTDAVAHTLWNQDYRLGARNLAKQTPPPFIPWDMLDRDLMQGYEEWCIAERFLDLLDQRTPEWTINDCMGRFTLTPTGNGKTAMLDCKRDDTESAATVFITRSQLLALADTALRIARALDGRKDS